MVDTVFKIGVRRTNLYQFRVKNSGDYRYVKAQNLHDASRRLEAMRFDVDTLQLAGELVEEEKV